MSDATLLQGGRVVSADGEYDGDVLIVGEKIAAVGSVDAPDDATTVDVSGCRLLPGLIDNHTHLSMPFMGMWSSDDYDTGTQAAAAGGVTCLVDFAIQREPDELRSALAEWQGRAEGAAHVDYGFHMAITNANEATIDDMQSMVDAGVSSFKLFMAYKGELMTRDDDLTATMDRARELNGLIMVHAENGDVIDLLVKRALARGDTSAIHHALTRPEFVEAEATGRAARLAEYTGASLFVVHVTCAAAAAEIEAAQQRGAHVSAETCTQYLVNTIDDLRRPGVEGVRYICSPPLRDASNHEPLWAYVRRGVLESISTDHCPFNYEQKSRGLDNFSLVPNGLPGDPAPAGEAVGRGRGGRPDHPEPARRRHEHDDRPPLRARVQGRDRAGQGRRHRGLGPERVARVRRRELVHERRLRPLRGRDGVRQRAPHVLPRHARLRPRRDQDGARPRPLRAARSAVGGGGVKLEIDADRVLADLRELAEATGGEPAGARRLAWSPDWLKAREWLQRQARRAARDRRSRRGGQHLGRAAGGRRRLRHRRLAHRRGAVGRLARRRARDRRRARRAARAAAASDAAGQRALRRLGRRGGRALRSQPARLVGRGGHARPRRRARPERRRGHAPRRTR